VIGVSHLHERALCASAVTRRAWGDGVHHVLDGRTGAAVRDVVATWVVADEAATADGLATALFFTMADDLVEVFRFSYVRMFADGRLEISENFDGALFTHPAADGMSVGHGRSDAREHAGRSAMKGEGTTVLSRRVRVATLAGIFVSLVMVPCGPTGMALVCSTAASDAGPASAQSTISRDAAYADGVYTATGQYGSLPSSITVTVTLVDDVITAGSVTPHATNPTSLEFQRRFAAAVPVVVVGKRIDEVKLDRVAGSSGTPLGFNAALERIKEQARIGRTTPK
jgi:uncharacterized protein with FMN-binding domain